MIKPIIYCNISCGGIIINVKSIEPQLVKKIIRTFRFEHRKVNKYAHVVRTLTCHKLYKTGENITTSFWTHTTLKIYTINDKIYNSGCSGT